MKRIRGHHILFGITLMALAALGSWWTVFFLRAIELEKTARLDDLVHATALTALTLGQAEEAPAFGPVPQTTYLEIVPTTDVRQGDIFDPLLPNFPDRGIRPAARMVEGIEAKLRRRRLMLAGEGILLFLLLGVCTYMLYRLVRQEHQNIQRMEDFMSAVTHEMKTPLTGIKSMLQTFAAGRVPQAEQARLWVLGLKETERLEHMVENILASGRLRGGHFQVHNQAVELKPFLEEFADHRKRYRVGQPGSLDLVWEPAPAQPVAWCDPQALRIVLENLADNAFKYGGDTPRVTVRVGRDGNRITISMEDDGIGFDPAKSDELFVAFHRSAGTRSSIQHGTGLGLSIARALVRQMGGELIAESRGPGQGSRFTCSLREAAP